MAEPTDQSDPPLNTGTLRVAARMLRETSSGEGRRITVGVVLLLIANVASLLQPWPLKLVIDSVAGDKPLPWGMDRFIAALGSQYPKFTLLMVLCLSLLLIELAIGLLNIISNYLLVAIGLRMVFNLRCRLFSHMQKLSLRFHDTTTVGDSLYRVTWDSYCAQGIFNTGVLPAVTATLTLIGIVAVMYSCDAMVVLVALAFAIPLSVMVRYMDRPMTEHSMIVHERESEISTRVQETLSGIRAVMAFGREKHESDRFRAHAESSLRANLRLTLVQTASHAVIGLLMAAGTALIVWISAYRVLQGRLTPGDVVLMAAYIAMIFKPLQELAYTASNIQSSVAGAQRCFDILDAQPDVHDKPDAKPLAARATGALAFENASFAYVAGRPVLRDVTLDIPAGSTVALVGPSGAGKTTLVSLIMRFYDPVSGRVLLDGQDLRDITVASLRQNIALVLQEPVLFCSTIGENIAYGRPDATPEQVEAAARSAGAHDFISAMPDGYETQIGERGVSLSGGQRQRIAIARAFLKDAPVLIMDEPTSALDAETESQLLAALERLKKGRTTLIIAHRLSTIRNANLIVVMQDGVVVESGSHAELLARGNLYARLHAVQFGALPAAATV